MNTNTTTQATPDATDAHLDAATLAQLTWKPNVVRNIGIAVCRHFLKDRIAYTDAINLDFVTTADANCIGLTFRRLREQGIICETGRFKRNDKTKRPGRRGGKAYQYRLASYARAETFLKRNGWTEGLGKGQTEMFAELAEKPAEK